MVSVVICSINNELQKQIKENIDVTIGIPFEIIVIENLKSQYSLCQAYNLGAAQATFANLLFLHEDVAFHTNNWGLPLVTLLSNSEIGLVGVSGTVYKSAYPSTWSMIPQEYYRINAIQQWKNGSKTTHITKDFENVKFSRVAVIDGVFMAMRKSVWKQFPFDEQNLKGFHFYDLAMGLQVGKYFNIVVSHEILLEHFSEGTLSNDWILESIRFHNRHKKQLPSSIILLPKKEHKKIEYHALSSFVFILIRNKHFLLALNYYLICFKYFIFKKTNLDIAKYYVKTIL